MKDTINEYPKLLYFLNWNAWSSMSTLFQVINRYT